MRQITEQLNLVLSGGWFQGDFGFKKKHQKKDYGKRTYQYDWVEWLFCKLSTELDSFRTAWVASAEFARGAYFIALDVLRTPVTRRSKSDRKHLIQWHIQKAIARKKKAQYDYRAKKWAWIFN